MFSKMWVGLQILQKMGRESMWFATSKNRWSWDPVLRWRQVGLHGRTPGGGEKREKIQEIQEGQGENGWGRENELDLDPIARTQVTRHDKTSIM